MNSSMNSVHLFNHWAGGGVDHGDGHGFGLGLFVELCKHGW